MATNIEMTLKESTPSTPVYEDKSTAIVDFGMRQSAPSDGSAPSDSSDESDLKKTRLSLRTFLAVLSVCLIYFAQLISLVGAGVVSWDPPSFFLTGDVGT